MAQSRAEVLYTHLNGCGAVEQPAPDKKADYGAENFLQGRDLLHGFINL